MENQRGSPGENGRKRAVPANLYRYVLSAGQKLTAQSSIFLAGRARVCFEHLIVPDTGGKRVAVLRVLDMITPVERNLEAKLPKEPPEIHAGSLFPSIDAVTGDAKPWYRPDPESKEGAEIEILMSLPQLR